MSAEKPPINTSELNLAEQQHDPMQNLREENNEYTKLYPEVMANLNSIAKKAGFKELLAHPMFKSIMATELFKDYCFFPPEGLKNQKLIQEIDKDFADKGMFSVLEHEKQHFENPAKKAADKPEKYPKEATMEEINKTYNQKAVKIENQVNLQTLNNKFTELSEKKEDDTENNIKDKIKNSIAIENIYTDFIYKGVDILKQESMEDRYLKVYKFLKEDTIKEIVKEENRIKKELLEKYNGMLKNGKC